MYAGQEQVGLDKTNRNAGLQNAVPTPAYAQDPFAGAQVTRNNEQFTDKRAGFRSKGPTTPLYQSDPLAIDTNNPFRTERENIEQFGTTEQLQQFDQSERDKVYYEKKRTRLDDYKESGEVTAENIADIYSLKEDELEDYGIDIKAENTAGAPEGITSGWNDADGDGYDDDGHAYGTHGAVNVPTRHGEQSIQDVFAELDAPEAEKSWWDKTKEGIDWGLNKADEYAQPKQTLTSWGDDFTTSPGGAISAALPGPIGGIAALGGELSRRNLENIHEEYGEFGSKQEGLGLIPKESIPGVNTPLAVSEGFIPGTTVVSGNTDLALQQNPEMDLNQDGQLNADELQDYMAQQKQLEEAQRIEDQRLRELAEQQAAAAKAAQERREAKERAEREAKAQEDARRAEAQRRANESGREQTYGGGSAVTDSRGRAVRDSHGQVVTDRQVTVRPERDSGGGGGGGGGDSCFSADAEFEMKDGSLKPISEIKVGDIVAEGGRVYGVLHGDGELEDWYRYGDTFVTGSHFVREEGRWIPVENSKQAVYIMNGFDKWYCVLNEKHRLLSSSGTLFTDFDGVDSINKELEVRLNETQ